MRQLVRTVGLAFGGAILEGCEFIVKAGMSRLEPQIKILKHEKLELAKQLDDLKKRCAILERRVAMADRVIQSQKLALLAIHIGATDPQDVAFRGLVSGAEAEGMGAGATEVRN